MNLHFCSRRRTQLHTHLRCRNNRRGHPSAAIANPSSSSPDLALPASANASTPSITPPPTRQQHPFLLLRRRRNQIPLLIQFHSQQLLPCLPHEKTKQPNRENKWKIVSQIPNTHDDDVDSVKSCFKLEGCEGKIGWTLCFQEDVRNHRFLYLPPTVIELHYLHW